MAVAQYSFDAIASYTTPRLRMINDAHFVPSGMAQGSSKKACTFDALYFGRSEGGRRLVYVGHSKPMRLWLLIGDFRRHRN
jgi:hypothetical protein